MSAGEVHVRSSARGRRWRPPSGLLTPTSRWRCGFLYLVAIIDWASRAVPGMAAVEHQRCELLRGGAGGGAASVWKAADFQYRSGLHFHRRGFRQQACDGRRRDFRWTDAAPLHGTACGTFSSNGCGARSSYEESLHLKAGTPMAARRGPASVPGMNFIQFSATTQAMNNQMPMAVWRAGMDKIEVAARAVDMPLRLDNANALPTYPQQKQQEAALILEGQRQARLHLKFNDPLWSHQKGVQF